MRSYELITIHDPAKLENGRKAVSEILSRNKATGHKEEDWGDKRMPHDDGTMPMGRFLLHTLHADPSAIKEMEHELQLEASVARYMFGRGE
ncbi:MAG: 30S ribosomal protein S6 [bacterium]|nr:30S ribosomal protein S6 [bacterium]